MLDSFDVVEAVVQSDAGVDRVRLVKYIEGPNWLEAADACEAGGQDRVFLGLRQDIREREILELPKCDVSAERLRSVAASLDCGNLLGLISRVQLAEGTEAHIPMMDFKCGPSSANQGMLRRLLNGLELGRGFLLESGRSYHYYGCKLLNPTEWREFLGRCLLMTGFSDDRYIGHQLVDGHCVLRLSSGELRDHVPAVVEELS